MGTAAIEVRVCACPIRDRRAAEKRRVGSPDTGSLTPRGGVSAPRTPALPPAACAPEAGGAGQASASAGVRPQPHVDATAVQPVIVRGSGNYIMVSQLVARLAGLPVPSAADLLRPTATEASEKMLVRG